jgi:Mg/Co/Ni transporter MgtE
MEPNDDTPKHVAETEPQHPLATDQTIIQVEPVADIDLDALHEVKTQKDVLNVDLDKTPDAIPQNDIYTDDDANDDEALLGNGRHTSRRSSSSSIRSMRDKDFVDEDNYWEHSIWYIVRQRSVWLVLLLFIQSFSSFILSTFEALLERHVIITLFLTMMIGTGGNSGAQSTVLVIRGLATGTIQKDQIGQLVWKEARIGLILSILLAFIGALRVLMYEVLRIWQGHQTAFGGELFAISLALFCIVWTSVIIGTLLPLFLHYVLKLDPANSSPTVGVVMDIIGVLITVS